MRQMYSTPLGIYIAKDKDNYIKHSQEVKVLSYDMCYEVEKYIRGMTKSDLDFNLSTIRENLMVILRGDTNDKDYIKAFIYCYDNSPLFAYYIRYLYVIYNGNLNLILMGIKPLVSKINLGVSLYTNIVGGITRFVDNGYIYVTNPTRGCDNPYVEVW